MNYIIVHFWLCHTVYCTKKKMHRDCFSRKCRTEGFKVDGVTRKVLCTWWIGCKEWANSHPSCMNEFVYAQLYFSDLVSHH